MACETRQPPSPAPVEPQAAAPGRPFARLRLGDRLYVEAVLTDVFGPSIASDLKTDIRSNPAVFGGSCNLYEQVFTDDGTPLIGLEDEATGCLGGMPALNHPLVGSSSTLRAGWLAKICRSATNRPAAVRFALADAFPDGTLGPPNTRALKVAFQKFFPERELPAAVAKALLAIAPTAKPEERWKLILNALCLTPDWQIP